MKILLPIDGSAHADRAVTHVISDLKNHADAVHILLLNVQWKVTAGNVKLFINQNTIDDYYREQGMLALAQARAKLDAASLPYQYHISIGTPAAAIIQYANEQGVDQIVMTKQGQGGLHALLLGSVASEVMRLATCPVLIIE
jgi:nucleotide-binding universal stress UspA family protein